MNTAIVSSRRAACFAAALCALLAAGPGRALAGTAAADRLVAEGYDFFRKGNYFRASESFRCAVFEDMADGRKKLAFGHSLFALGNYAYAAYSIRRGVRFLGFPDDLAVDIVAQFPSRSAFDRALRDARRYLQFYPGDPHALTVIAYASYFSGDAAEAESSCKRLLAVDGRDALAAYLLRRIEMEHGGGTTLTAKMAKRAAAPAPPPPQAQPLLAPAPAPAPKILEPVRPKAPAAVAKKADEPKKAEEEAKEPPDPGERLGTRHSISKDGDAGPRPAIAK